MNFRPELAEAVVSGRKTVTRRLVREDNPRSPWSPERAPKLVGKRVAICPGRGKHRIGEATVVDVRRERFVAARISEQEARREGFSGSGEFRAVWHELHGGDLRPAWHDYLRAYDVWRIELADPAPAGGEGTE